MLKYFGVGTYVWRYVSMFEYLNKQDDQSVYALMLL